MDELHTFRVEKVPSGKVGNVAYVAHKVSGFDLVMGLILKTRCKKTGSHRIVRGVVPSVGTDSLAIPA